MDEVQARRALQAYKQLIRIAKHPEREPAWLMILADLVEARDFYRGLTVRSPDEDLMLHRICKALERY